MEWLVVLRTDEDLMENIPNMMDLLTCRKYTPIRINGDRLDKSQWRKWPENMIWMLRNTTVVHHV